MGRTGRDMLGDCMQQCFEKRLEALQSIPPEKLKSMTSRDLLTEEEDLAVRATRYVHMLNGRTTVQGETAAPSYGIV